MTRRSMGSALFWGRARGEGPPRRSFRPLPQLLPRRVLKTHIRRSVGGRVRTRPPRHGRWYATSGGSKGVGVSTGSWIVSAGSGTSTCSTGLPASCRRPEVPPSCRSSKNWNVSPSAIKPRPCSRPSGGSARTVCERIRRRWSGWRSSCRSSSTRTTPACARGSPRRSVTSPRAGRGIARQSTRCGAGCRSQAGHRGDCCRQRDRTSLNDVAVAVRPKESLGEPSR